VFNPDAAYVATEVRMLLASTSVDECFVGLEEPHSSRVGLRVLIVGDIYTLNATKESLEKKDGISVQAANDEQSGSAFFASRSSQRSGEVWEGTAADFLSAKRSPEHVTITAINVPVKEFFSSWRLDRIVSLDLSRLNLDDVSLCAIASRGDFGRLKWLDLSGNHALTDKAVTAIAELYSCGQFQNLRWLNLIGTSCDATPYVDGYSWRMPKITHEIAKRHGYQPWMMLGTRSPGEEGAELLTENDMKVPPDRFKPSEDVQSTEWKVSRSV